VPQLLGTQYRELKALARGEVAGEAIGRLILQMASHAREMLERSDRVELHSLVAEKSYFAFRANVQSRAVNHGLYADEAAEFRRLLRAFGSGFRGTSEIEIVKAAYTIAYSVFAAHDVYSVGRKASATFFEILIGHIIGRALGVSPRRKVRVPESGAELPTDYVFDPGPGSRKIHLPIKTSTRERAVQAWVHQLVLERIFGTGQYRGILVVAAETKQDSRTGEVIEICVPKQLQMFQSRVAEITRIYYLDPPQPYLALANEFPRVEVRSFGSVLADLQELLRT